MKWELQQMIKQGHGGSIISIASIKRFQATIQHACLQGFQARRRWFDEDSNT
jgi:hypothetical protein